MNVKFAVYERPTIPTVKLMKDPLPICVTISYIQDAYNVK